MQPRELAPDRIGIFETSLGGHRGNYIRILVEALNEIDVQPIVLLPESEVERPEYQEFLVGLESRFRLRSTPFVQATGPKTIGKERYRALAQSIHEHDLQHVYIPYVDGLVQWMGAQRTTGRSNTAIRACAIEGLLLRGGFAYPGGSILSALKRRVSMHLILRAGLKRLHILDPRVFQFLRDRYGENPTIRFMPELLDAWTSVSKEDAIASIVPDWRAKQLSSRPLITCPGLVDERKGVDLLLESFAEGKLYESARLVLAGSHSDSIRNALNTRYASLVASGSILTVDRFLTEEEFRNLFWMSDLVCLPYPNHVGVSSIYLRAVALGKRVITSDRGWFAWAVPHYGIGTSVNVFDKSSFSRAMRHTLGSDPLYQGDEISKGARVLSENTATAVKACWLDVLRSRLPRREFATILDAEPDLTPETRS